MIEPIKILNRYIMKTWAQTGRGLGYIFNILDNHPNAYNQKTLTTKLRGDITFTCNLNDHVQSRIYFFGAYEPIEVFLLNSLLDSNSVVLDVGANVGFYSLFLSNKITAGHIHAFEPVPSNLLALKNNIDVNHRKNRITAHPFGLWNQKTTLTFSLPAGMSNNVGSFTAGTLSDGLAPVNCDVTTLDLFVQDHQISQIDFIKMDIEGAEYFALQGGEKTIAALKPNFLLEINPGACARFKYTVSDIDAFLKKYNYVFYKIGGSPEDSGFIDSLESAHQMNIFALNASTVNRLNLKWNRREIYRYFQQP